MFNAPKTLKEAKAYRYNIWGGNPNGHSFKEGKCAYEIMSNYLTYQCSRSDGHGPDCLYCKQHAKMVCD